MRRFTFWFRPVLSHQLLAFIVVFSSVTLARPLVRCDSAKSLPSRSLVPSFTLSSKKACFPVGVPPTQAGFISHLSLIPSMLSLVLSAEPTFLVAPDPEPVLTVSKKHSALSKTDLFNQLVPFSEVADHERLRLKEQFLQINNQRQRLSKEDAHTSLFIAIVNGSLKVILVPGAVIREPLLNAVYLWLLDVELTLYWQALPLADLLELLPKLQFAITAAAGGDGDDPGRDPDDNQESTLFVAGDFMTVPWVPDLYEQSVLLKRRLLRILRQRVQQVIASGRQDLAQILRNRIMIIEADLSDLKYNNSLASANPAFQALLLAGLMEHTQEMQESGDVILDELLIRHPDADGQTVTQLIASLQNQVQHWSDGRSQPPVRQATGGSKKKKGNDGQGTGAGQPVSASQPSSQVARLSRPYRDGSSGNGPPGPEQGFHTYSLSPCPLCNGQPCVKRDPGSSGYSGDGEQAFILTLPTELLALIFEYTTLSDRISIANSCKHFKEVVCMRKVLVYQALNQYQGEIAKTRPTAPGCQIQRTGLETRLTQFFLKMEKSDIDFTHFPLVTLHLLARFYMMAPTVCTHTLTGHTGRGLCIKVLPDGRVLSGASDCTIRVWDLTQPEGERCTHTLTGHTNRVLCIKVLPDGRVLSGAGDCTIRVWDLTQPEGERCTHILTGHTNWVRCIKVLPDGRVLSCSDDKTIKVWDLTKPDEKCCTHTLAEHINPVVCIKILPDGRVLSGSASGTGIGVGASIGANTIKVWDLTQPEGKCCTHTLTGHTNPVLSIKVLPDGRVLSCSFDGTIKVWDLTEPHRKFCTHTLTKHGTPVSCIEVLPDSRVLSGSYDGTIKVWDLTKPDGKCCTHTLTEHTVWICCIAVLPDGRILSGSKDETIKVWDLTKPDGEYRTRTGYDFCVNDIEPLPAGLALSDSSDASMSIMLSCFTKSDGERCTHTLAGHTNWVYCVKVLPGGRVLSCSADKTIKVWDYFR